MFFLSSSHLYCKFSRGSIGPTYVGKRLLICNIYYINLIINRGSDLSSFGHIAPGSSCCSLRQIIADYNSGLLDDSVGKMEKKQLGKLK